MNMYECMNEYRNRYDYMKRETEREMRERERERERSQFVENMKKKKSKKSTSTPEDIGKKIYWPKCRIKNRKNERILWKQNTENILP